TDHPEMRMSHPLSIQEFSTLYIQLLLSSLIRLFVTFSYVDRVILSLDIRVILLSKSEFDTPRRPCNSKNHVRRALNSFANTALRWLQINRCPELHRMLTSLPAQPAS